MEGKANELKQISEEQAQSFLKETYADPEAAGKFFKEMIAHREKALEGLAGELNDDRELADTFARNPIGFLNDRKLLGPLDRITLDGLRNPFVDWPWPWPICHLHCTLEVVT